MNCEQCGRLNPVGYKFCGGCGALAGPLSQALPPPPVFYAPQSEIPRRPSEFNWNRVNRFEVGIVVGSFLTIVGFFLPWVSTFGFSVSGLTLHSFLWFAFLLLLGVMVLSILKIFVPGFSENWPFETALTGMVLFSGLLVVIALIDSPGGFSWSIGPFWCLIMVAATGIASLAPFVVGFQFLRVPIATSTSSVSGTSSDARTSPPSESGSSRRFCSACGNPIDSGERFCSSCGAVAS